MLEKLIGVYAQGPEDDEALSIAAGGAFPDLIDDAENPVRLIAFLRENPSTKLGLLDIE